MRSFVRGLVCFGVAGSLAMVPLTGAYAAPPVGCVGFPAIPAAYVCITAFTPQNQVPTAGQNAGTTFLVPAFCAFSQCVGPTPVTVPDVYVGQGEGAIAVVYYNGSTYSVPVVQAPTFTMSGALHNPEVGWDGWGTFSGSFTGVIHGHSYVNASISGDTAFSDNFDTCPVPVSGHAETIVTITDGIATDSARMDLNYWGPVVEADFWLVGTFTATGAGTRVLTSTTGNACFEPGDYAVSVAGVVTG